MKRNVLVALEQALISFHGGEILGVRLPGGLIGATLQSLCRMLKIAKHGQLQRILRDEVLSKHLLLVIVDTPGGQQAVEVLTAQAIPTWLTGLQPSMVAPEKRPLILALKEEAVEVLYRHFFHIDAEPQPEQPHTLPGSPFQMIYTALQTIGEAVQILEADQQADKEHLAALDRRQAVFEETQRAMGEHLVETRESQAGIEATQQAMGRRQEVAEEWHRALGDYVVETREQQEDMREQVAVLGEQVVAAEQRVTALEQRVNSTPVGRVDAGPPSDSPMLSPLHLSHLYGLARDERQRSGTAVSEQLVALAEAFGVPDVSDLPDAAWEDVLAWFWEQRRQHG